MQNVKNYDDLVEKHEKQSQAYWPREVMRTAGRKVLLQLSTYNGTKSQLSEEAKKWVYVDGKNIFTLADQNQAASLLTAPSDDSFFSAGEKMKKGGGWTEYSEKMIKVTSLAGIVTEVPNTAVPVVEPALPFPYLTQLTTVVAQLVTVKSRKWIPITIDSSLKVMVEAYKDTGIVPTSFRTVQGFLVDLFELDPVWQVMEDKQKDGVSGAQLLQMVKMILSRVPETMWLLLNAMLSSSVFAYFSKTRKGWVEGPIFDKMNDPQQNQYKQAAFVPADTVGYSKAAKKMRDKIQVYAPYAVIYQGGWVPLNFCSPVRAGTAQSALKGLTFIHSICGKGNSVNFLLDGAIGHSGLPTDLEKRLDFVLSIVLGLWARGRTPLIFMSSVGDIPYIDSSLTMLKSQIEKSKDVLFGSERQGKWITNALEWQFRVGSQADVLKVNVNIRPRVVTAPVSGAVTVFYEENTPASMEADKISEETVAKDSALILPSGSYVGYCSVFGYAHFADDEKLQRKIKTALSGDSLREAGYCFKFGSAASLRGAVSSSDLPALSMVGKEKGSFKQLILTRVETASAWYSTVERDQFFLSLRWLAPKTSYSCISNLIHITKKVTQLIAQDEIAEASGFFVPDTVLTKMKDEKKKVLGWRGEEDEEQSSEEEEEDDEEDSDEAVEDSEEEEEDQDHDPRPKKEKRVADPQEKVNQDLLADMNNN